MDIELDTTKDVNWHASKYYDKAKKAKTKLINLKLEIEKTKKLILMHNSNIERKEKQIKQKIRPKKWYEEFHWFKTTNGFLVIAGRSAKQNDMLYAKNLEDDDLFFHADVQGAAATILKNGATAKQIDRDETARFAACHSKAWVMGYSNINVYHVTKEQVGKHATGGHIAQGGFTLTGKREWYKSTPLMLSFIETEGELLSFPGRKKGWITIVPGGSTMKNNIVKKIKKKYGYDSTELSRIIPSGKSVIIEAPKNGK